MFFYSFCCLRSVCFTVPLSGNDHGTTALSKEDISKDPENTANETSGVGMPSTVHGAAGDDQHSGPSPHTANVQSTILSVAPSDGHGTTVVSSDGGAMELHSTVTSGVRSSAGHSTEGGSADAATGNKPGSDFSKEHNVTMETTAVIEQATSGFQGDWDNRTVSNITASEHNSGASIPLLSSTVDPVTGRGRIDRHH